jgi:formamidase
VEPGEVVEIETRDALDGQIGPTPRDNEIAKLDPTRAHPLTGPIFIASAAPGDLLEVEVLSVRPQPFGFTICSPRYGRMKRHFPTAFVARWNIANGVATSPEIPGVAIPAAPFMGIMGVALSRERLEWYRAYEAALFERGIGRAAQEPLGAIPPSAAEGLRTLPPRDNGGNIDVKYLTAGAVLRLPVQVEGALFSTGDAHFAQGDNECCTGIEMDATLLCRFRVLKGAAVARGIQDPQVYRARPGAETRATAMFYTTGQSYSRDSARTYEDLNMAAENAILNMISHLKQEYGFTTEQAAIVCSVAIDLKISEFSNDPNYLVTAALPLDIFRPNATPVPLMSEHESRDQRA